MDEFRSKGGKKAAKVAIIGNIILTILNIAVGLLSGSYALVSEGAHTLSDVATSIIAYIGFEIGQKPADKEHPIGHGRAEAISGLVIVIFLAVVSYEIITGAIEKILHPELIVIPSTLAAIMAVVGIIVNLRISEYIISIGKQINSPAIVADGQHQKTDIFSSVAVLVGVIVSNMGFPILDPIVGLIIGGLIIKTAFEIAKDNINNIMGKVPSEELINEIRDIANESININTAHNIKVDYLGSYATVTLHIELDGDMSLTESHELAHTVQEAIVEKVPIVKSATVHTCPIGLEYNHEQQIDK
ncbi:cation diffusion facilitator family transporter [uncultured Methanobrevibacter sp.]|uniref:cation diffusion facilitator family transporter n=1 Tax=uncultured Methanobrevibacter sp. TaxID=253161 RepID=UPI0025FDA836|nr:cation diffusion facilitator family transporter [uncultured Methanobrevibacter sp.]